MMAVVVVITIMSPNDSEGWRSAVLLISRHSRGLSLEATIEKLFFPVAT